MDIGVKVFLFFFFSGSVSSRFLITLFSIPHSGNSSSQVFTKDEGIAVVIAVGECRVTIREGKKENKERMLAGEGD